jgi:hypothetical protein
VSQVPDAPDFRETEVSKRQTWHGAKKYIKFFLSLRMPNMALRAASAIQPGLNARGRLPAPRHVKEVEGRVGQASFTMLRPDQCIIAKEDPRSPRRRPQRPHRTAARTKATTPPG